MKLPTGPWPLPSVSFTCTVFGASIEQNTLVCHYLHFHSWILVIIYGISDAQAKTFFSYNIVHGGERCHTEAIRDAERNKLRFKKGTNYLNSGSLKTGYIKTEPVRIRKNYAEEEEELSTGGNNLSYKVTKPAQAREWGWLGIGSSWAKNEERWEMDPFHGEIYWSAVLRSWRFMDGLLKWWV